MRFFEYAIAIVKFYQFFDSLNISQLASSERVTYIFLLCTALLTVPVTNSIWERLTLKNRIYCRHRKQLDCHDA